MELLIVLFKGFFVGLSDTIPKLGFSTPQAALDIFENIIISLKNIKKNPKKHLMFLAPYIFGILAGLLFFSSIISYLYGTFSFQTTLFFVGLMCGSMHILYKNASGKPYAYYGISAAGFLLVLIINLFKEQETAYFVCDNVFVFSKLVISGVFTAAAFFTPGFYTMHTMKIFGVHETITKSFSDLKLFMNNYTDYELFLHTFANLLPFVLGAVIGGLLIINLLHFCFTKIKQEIYLFIFGSVIAGLLVVLCDSATYATGFGFIGFFLGIITLLIGGALSYLLTKKY